MEKKNPSSISEDDLTTILGPARPKEHYQDAGVPGVVIGLAWTPVGGDILFTHTGSNDPSITLQNRVQVNGADLQSFLSQATQLAQKGQDVNAYIDASAKILEKADDDDFISKQHFACKRAIDTDYLTSALSFNHIRFKTLTVAVVDHKHLLEFYKIGRIHQIAVNGDATYIIYVSLSHRYSVNLRLAYLYHHGAKVQNAIKRIKFWLFASR